MGKKGNTKHVSKLVPDFVLIVPNFLSALTSIV